MHVVEATLKLYRDALQDAGRALGRSVWAVIALIITYAVIVAAELLLLPFGLPGGLIFSLIHAGAVGWYLSLVEIGVTGSRRVTARDLQENVGHYLWEVISVLFIFWIGGMILGLTVPFALPIAVIVCTLLFNPAPEMIYQDRTQSFALLQDATGFMQRNWPEWLGAQVMGAVVLALWGRLVLGALDPALGVELVQAFGPWFGFVTIGGLAIATAKLSGFLGAAFILLFSHFFMLFRGCLYKRLRHSSRRSRAWQSRLGG